MCPEGLRLLKCGGGGSKDHPWKLVRAGPVYTESFIPQAMLYANCLPKEGQFHFSLKDRLSIVIELL